MPRKIIAIIDTLSNDVAGQLMLFPHDAPAIRFFGDVATHPESQVAKHIEDYQLVQLGILDDDCSIITDRRILITGSQWKTMHDQLQAKAIADGASTAPVLGIGLDTMRR